MDWLQKRYPKASMTCFISLKGTSDLEAVSVQEYDLRRGKRHSRDVDFGLRDQVQPDSTRSLLLLPRAGAGTDRT